MSISALGTGAAASFNQTYDVAVAKKAIVSQDAQRKDALALIESAKAPPLQPGQSINVMA